MKKHFSHVSTIIVGKNTVPKVAQWVKENKVEKAFVLSDSRLKDVGSKITSLLSKKGCETAHVSIDVDENVKSFKSVQSILAKMIETQMDRRSVMIALGGGVIGDLGGFVASIYFRQIRWIGIPTTLLAQVDSAFGGKTGINFAGVKNSIGTFHEADCVIVDTQLLKTLERRDIISGLGEVVKYGLILDKPLFQAVQKNWEAIAQLKSPHLEKAIAKCIALKVNVVKKDPLETQGIRDLLNFGHTFCHALESATDFQYYRHGEAVIWGMRAACLVSLYQGHLSAARQKQIDAFLQELPVPEIPSSISNEELIQLMNKDKKAIHGKIRWVLIKDIGKSVLDKNVSLETVDKVLTELRSYSMPSFI